jgi:phage terminase large subunit-like protein
VKKIAFDRWHFDHLKARLVDIGFTAEELEARFTLFGQGFRSMSPALNSLEGVLLNGKLAHGDHPVLRMCAINAVVEMDAAGNRKLTKAKSTGRIDGMIALAMAIDTALSNVEEPDIGAQLEAAILERGGFA